MLPFHELSPHVQELPNGLQVVVAEQPHLHSVAVGAYVKTGVRFEPKGRDGISHFLEHVLFRGNEKYRSPVEMNRAFEGWGGSLNGYTTREYTFFFGRIHPSHLEDGVEFFSYLLSRPLLEGIELERSIIKEEQLDGIDEDGQELDLETISRAAIWGDHPMGRKIAGPASVVKRLGRAHLDEHHREFFGASNMVLVVNGRCEHAQVLEWAERYLGDLPRGSAAESAPVTWRASRGFVSAVSHPASQVELLLSFHAPGRGHPDYAAMVLLSRILDDGMSSRLWRTVVEDLGLCYELWSGWDAYADTGVLDIGGTMTNDKLMPLVEEIHRQLNDLRTNGPEEGELALARRRWLFDYEFALDRVEWLNERLGRDFLFRQHLPFDRLRDNVEAVDQERVRKLAETWLTSDGHMVSAVGPLGKGVKKFLRDQARAF